MTLEIKRMRTVVFILGLAAFAAAQEAPRPESGAKKPGNGESAKTGMVTIRLGAATEIREVLETMVEATGEAILFDPNGQRIRGQKVGATIEKTVPRARLLDTYRAILAFYELTLVSVGPSGYEIYLVMDSRSTNNFLKNRATNVPFAQLEKWADREGHYISCAIPVTNIENLTTLRTAMSTMVSPAGIGRVHEVPGSHSIVVMDFAPTVVSIARIVRTMDAERAETRGIFAVIDLKHGRAADVAATVSKLLEKPAPAASRRGYRPSTRAGIRVVAYASRNAVAVSCRQDELTRIKGLVAQLDQPRPDERSLELIHTRHVRATQLANTLAQVLAGSTSRIIADERTNALIVAASGADMAIIRNLIKLLDVPQPGASDKQK